MSDFMDTVRWKLEDDLTVAVYEHTRTFPKEEIYGLTAQLRRAAYSVPANTAEGSARGTNGDSLHLPYIARGSLSEAQCLIYLVLRLGYMPDATDRLCVRARRQLSPACMASSGC